MKETTIETTDTETKKNDKQAYKKPVVHKEENQNGKQRFFLGECNTDALSCGSPTGS